ncbi:unnamed protein product [Hymenolepis diminuta]|uniref:Uncharacterized protein n=1 Tax=Hymenolepis diminuta TaxID=6216 RepID=A0A564XX37_HYMDI|nr:unnamed protein product [Hymenolepis diminuta]
MTTCNCSEFSFLEHPAFRPKPSFLKREGENHLLQVFSSTTFPFHFHKCL